MSSGSRGAGRGAGRGRGPKVRLGRGQTDPGARSGGAGSGPRGGALGRSATGKGGREREHVIYGASPALRRVDTRHVMAKARSAPSQLRAALAEHPFLGRLTRKERTAVASELRRVELREGEALPADPPLFGIVQAGRVRVGGAGGEVVRAGGAVGEAALAFGEIGLPKVEAIEASEIWAISGEHFRATIASQHARDLGAARRTLERCEALQGLSKEDMGRCLVALDEERVEPGTTLVRRGARMEGVAFIRSGSLWIVRGSARAKLGPGDMVGEEGAMWDIPAFADIVAEEEDGERGGGERGSGGGGGGGGGGSGDGGGDIVLFRMPSADVVRLLAPARDGMLRAGAAKALMLVSSLQMAPRATIRKLAKEGTVRKYEAASAIAKAGSVPSALLIVRSGSVRMGSGPDAREAGPGEVLGASELAQTPRQPLRFSLTAGSAGCTCFAFPPSAFQAALSTTPPSSPTATPTPTSAPGAARGGGGEGGGGGGGGGSGGGEDGELERILRDGATLKTLRALAHDLDDSLSRDDLVPLRTIGVGTFGRVRMVRDRRSGKHYALKTLQKARVIKLRQQRNVLYERAVLGALRHPFLIRLHSAFQDEKALYMVLELVLGGELFSLLEQHDRLPEGPARFYTSCVLSALVHLHQLHILYRDLKPENLLLDKTGYIRICDFGFAKFVPSGERTFTLCGTPEYLAPEVLRSAGHNEGADIWALGVLLYEMLFARSPFAPGDDEPEGDNMATFKRILRAASHLSFPSDIPVHRNTLSLLRGLLTPELKGRLGCGAGGTAAIKDHAFFRGIDWAKLEAKEIRAPWVPELTSETDTSFFEDYSDEESDVAGAGAATDEDEPIPPGADLSWCKDF